MFVITIIALLIICYICCKILESIWHEHEQKEELEFRRVFLNRFKGETISPIDLRFELELEEEFKIPDSIRRGT